jgi:eukaryotic-like serine/threonine-protein kinase
MTPGTRLGPYKIEGPLGAGGMGEVFHATDTRLGRAVAIKTSREQFSERFDREARAISSLNHPHICTLYDVGPNYLVMEFCDGQTLAARLRRGKLSIQETLRYGTQIADALSAAHAKGIVHRDLKPGNIMIAKSGVKVLDFGLAKSQHDAAMTATNVVMGTPAYMAPEQREGKECDARTDIYALGLILYEMLTGKRAFDGSDAVSVIAAIMEREPLSTAEVALPTLDWALRRCLTKDPDERWQTARDLRAALEMVATGGIQIPRSANAVAKKNLLLQILAGALTIALAITCVFLWRATRPSRDASQAEFDDLQITQLTSTGAASTPAISPDGKYMAYVQRVGDAFSLRMRQIDTASEVQIAPPEPGMAIYGAAVTPDGGFVEFIRSSLTVVRQELWRVPFLGGTPRKLLDSFVSAAGGRPTEDISHLCGE